jgi:hypothetical protein
MCNCGNKRTAYTQQAGATKPVVSNTTTNVMNASFEYVGKTALTVIGNVTGKNYRFSYPGDKQLIDMPDIQGMLTVPVLKKLK